MSTFEVLSLVIQSASLVVMTALAGFIAIAMVVEWRDQ